ncbi:Ppx/GppA phosphatase family protein [Corynebacterium sp. Marseille-P4321]|uniref:Ppx/GppA phosphatase family protein n=1 Tax=Corynebacterium sp. Marseille-P4321 TaxID=2736603 RepID=UPI00158BF235|nr:Ppx/GppA phosphatase family protein [Corynebacterium sp. Marseille-P4321]
MTPNTSQRVAAVDCGTNSIRLLIHDAETGEVARENTIVRLGQGVDETGAFHPDAIARTQEALAAYVEQMGQERVTRVRMVATSATRDASNREVFFDMTRDLLGKIQPGAVAEVISGEEEASLSFAGATADMDAARGPFCVIDLGGGSTEFVMETSDGISAVSTQMGCVRVTERFMHTDPPTEAETLQARAFIDDRLAEAAERVPLAEANTFVGCAGTFTTLSALAQNLDAYDPEQIHMSEISFDRMREVTQALRAATSAQRAENPVVHPGRADVIAAGSTVVEQMMLAFEREAAASAFVISEKDILDGIVAKLLRP